MSRKRIAIAGGGAAGFFAAITCAEAAPGSEVTLFEKGPQFLAKVRISGGGRCNVTHHCFHPRELSTRYPRGGRALIGLFQRFQAQETVEWFESRGVKLKTEADGRMFPTTDTSQTVIDCLVGEARRVGVILVANRGIDSAARVESSGFQLTMSNAESIACDQLLLATGGARSPALAKLATDLGHTLVPPVPSLFTFQIETPWLRELSGLAVEARVSVPQTKLAEQAPMLITHMGLSGPAILRLSAWGARELHEMNYRFPLVVNWLPALNEQSVTAALHSRRTDFPARLIVNTPVTPLPVRLWEKLVLASGVTADTRWSNLSRSAQHALVQTLMRTQFQVVGKSLNKDEFVTCGGVPLNEVDMKTMQSRVCPGLFFAGELLDIDGITGGFNFQAAWTTGWIAGNAMSAE
ncbi:MAG TPA: NAD(P)/FAD-dependent oxidoreductase [Candidatus Acidoferrum sp.]|nr:NAD(P)/FAD-dependent oxidoreductase [Candidatus Acidoferrum sp.]